VCYSVQCHWYFVTSGIDTASTDVQSPVVTPFWPYSAFTCYVWFSQQTATDALNSINWLSSVMTRCVFCDVGIEWLSDLVGPHPWRKITRVAAAPPVGCDPCSVLLSRGQAAGCSIFCGQLVHWLLPEVACGEYTVFRRMAHWYETDTAARTSYPFMQPTAKLRPVLWYRNRTTLSLCLC